MNVLARDLWREVKTEFEVLRGATASQLWLRNARPLEFTRGIFKLGVPNDVVRQWLATRYTDDLQAIFLQLTGSDVRVRIEVDDALPRTPPAAPDSRSEPPAGDHVPFLVRPENRIAHAAIQRLFRDPRSGNPLFLYGPAGSGKTALVRHHLARLGDDEFAPRSTLSVTAEAFSESLVRSIHDRTVSAFRGRMLAADALILEEAHRLRGKTRTQREFLSILQYFVQRGRPVVLTSRHPPNAIFLLDEGLRSHFLSGILLRIADPGEASRTEILGAVADRFARPVPKETIARIVARVPGTLDRQVRFLEKIAAFAALEGEPATIEFVSQKFPELAGSGAREVDMDGLVEVVAREFGTTPAEIASNKKQRHAVLGRHVVVYLATVVFNLRARRVVRHLGGLSPSTTAYARRKIELLRREDPVFDARVKRLLEELDAGQKLLF